jgi:hypothetical protein
MRIALTRFVVSNKIDAMSRAAQAKYARLTSPASPAVLRALLVSMLIVTVLVVLTGGLRGVT